MIAREWLSDPVRMLAFAIKAPPEDAIMDEYFAATPATNATVLCVGGVTRAEAAGARDDGIEIDGLGYYLFLADEAEPSRPIEILAKLVSDTAAARLAQIFELRAA